MSALMSENESVRRKRADLRPVATTQKSHAWFKGSFPVAILLLLAVGMVGHLWLQTKIQDQAFELGALQTQADRLSAQEAILNATLDKQSTPQQLAYTAAELGMVANPYSTYLILPTGEIVGTDRVVRGNELPIISAPPEITPTSPKVTLDDPGAAAVVPGETGVPQEEPVPGEAEPAAEPDAAGAQGVPEEGTQP